MSGKPLGSIFGMTEHLDLFPIVRSARGDCDQPTAVHAMEKIKGRVPARSQARRSARRRFFAVTANRLPSRGIATSALAESKCSAGCAIELGQRFRNDFDSRVSTRTALHSGQGMHPFPGRTPSSTICPSARAILSAVLFP